MDLNLFILFYFILFYFILYYFIYFVLFYFILFCFECITKMMICLMWLKYWIKSRCHHKTKRKYKIRIKLTTITITTTMITIMIITIIIIIITLTKINHNLKINYNLTKMNKFHHFNNYTKKDFIKFKKKIFNIKSNNKKENKLFKRQKK